MATKSHTIWHGCTELTEQPDVLIEDTTEGITTHLQLCGPWQVCLEKGPKIGQTIKPYPGKVQGAKRKRDRGGKGTIDVVLVEESTHKGEPIGPPKYEIWNTEIEKPLETHPRYNEDSQFSKKITDAVDLGDLANSGITDEDEIKTYKKLYGTNPGGGGQTIASVIQVLKSATTLERNVTLKVVGQAEDLIKDFLKKWDAGTESYTIYAPLARKTTPYSGPVKPEKIGVIVKKPDVKNYEPNGYEWLKTEDRIAFTGKHGTCERVEEWKGAVTIDPDLYKKA